MSLHVTEGGWTALPVALPSNEIPPSESIEVVQLVVHPNVLLIDHG